MGTKFGIVSIAEAIEKGYIPAQIFVDGVRIKDVANFNDIEGWVEYYYHDGQEIGMEEIPLKRVYGDVLYIPAKGDLVF